MHCATIFVFGNQFPEDCNYNYAFESLAKLILEKCNSSWGKPSDYNYISEFQEELILQKMHSQLLFFFKSVRNLNCSHFGVDSNYDYGCRNGRRLQ